MAMNHVHVKIKVKNRAVKKKCENEPKERRTDTTEFLTLLANAVGKDADVLTTVCEWRVAVSWSE